MTKKVVILSNTGDEHSDMLVNACRESGHRVFRYNTDHFRLDGGLTWLFNSRSACHLQTRDHQWDVGETDLLLHRRPLFVHSRRQDIEAWVGRMLDSEWSTLEKAFGEGDNCRIVNPVAANEHASNKLVQLRTAIDVDLPIPETLISTDRDELLAFAERLPCITKAVGYCNIITDGKMRTGKTLAVSRDMLADFNPQGIPTLLQHRIEPAAMWRIVKVGPDLFGFRMGGTALQEDVDSRFVEERLDGEHAIVPDRIARGLHAMCDRLGIIYASSDFIEDAGGQRWFIDLNPEGQWGAYENRFHVPISHAIVSL